MTEKLPDHWDPTPHQRQWYSHRDSGERGYVVRRNGEDVIRENKVQFEIIHKLDHNWKEDKEHRPLNMAQLAQVAFVADQQLCRSIGLHDMGRKEWSHLLENERADWINGKGPKSPRIRANLFKQVWAALKDEAR